MRNGRQVEINRHEAKQIAKRLAQSTDETQGIFFSEFANSLVHCCGGNVEDANTQMLHASDYVDVGLGHASDFNRIIEALEQ